MLVKHTSLFCLSAGAHVGLESGLFEVKENVSFFLICVELKDPIKRNITTYLTVLENTATGNMIIWQYCWNITLKAVLYILTYCPHNCICMCT